MIRWVRSIAIAVLVLSLVGLGIAIGLFLVANGEWVPINTPPWLHGLVGDRAVDMWLPALLAGWLLAIIAVLGLGLWSMYYVWKRRQLDSLVRRLERELKELRNLPLTSPAPLEDLRDGQSQTYDDEYDGSGPRDRLLDEELDD